MSTFDRKPGTRAQTTELIHDPVVSPAGFNSLAPPEYRGSSTFFTDVAAQQAKPDFLGLDYSYGLHGNPTQYTLAKRLALIEQASHCLIAPSGLNAIALVVHSCLHTGDRWLIPSNVYGPVVALAIDLAQAMNVAYDVYDPMDLETLKQALTNRTQLVWVEAPGSLTFETPDLNALVKHVQTLCPHAKLAIDNTYSAGLTYKPLQQGFDFSIQALTKYQCGHADVLLGAVLSNNTEAFAAVERKNRLMGCGVSPTDCNLVTRGLLTLQLRYEKQAEHAMCVAQWLRQHNSVSAVLHPSMPDTPGHSHFQAQFSGAASLFSFALRRDVPEKQAEAFVNSLSLFHIAYSWGGPESLALNVQMPESRRKYLQKQLQESGAALQGIGPIIRLAIGLEDPNDLIGDLQLAFEKLNLH